MSDEILMDARGHRCPVPTLRLRRALEAAPAGGLVRRLADDPLARIDVPHFAASAGATADVQIHRGYPVTANDPALTAKMLPTLERIAPGKVKESELITGAEDFTYYQRQAPGLFFFLGITPPDQAGKAPSNHSPLFFVDESALPTGVRALAHLAVDYLASASKERQ